MHLPIVGGFVGAAVGLYANAVILNRLKNPTPCVCVCVGLMNGIVFPSLGVIVVGMLTK